MRDYMYYDLSPEVRTSWLTDVVDRLQDYDRCLAGLENDHLDVKMLTKILKANFKWEATLVSSYFKRPINLCHPENIRKVLYEIDYNLGLDIKRWHGFPVYFLFRYKASRYQQHFVLLEEIYRSKHYPFTGQRSLRLRCDQDEKVFINALPYRPVIQHFLRGKKKRKNFNRRINYTLNQVAEILNLAWDEDFELTRRLCTHLKIRHIVEAMELTHLILCTDDFSWLRGRPNLIIQFFMEHYEHPHLGHFLNEVQMMDYRQWTERVDQAKKDYLKLKVVISQLFTLEISSSVVPGAMPLWEWVFVTHEKDFPLFHQDDKLDQVIDEMESVGERVLNRSGEIRDIKDRSITV